MPWLTLSELLARGARSAALGPLRKSTYGFEAPSTGALGWRSSVGLSCGLGFFCVERGSVEFAIPRYELHDGATSLVEGEVWNKGVRERAVGRSSSSPNERDPIMLDGVSYRAMCRERENIVDRSIGERELFDHKFDNVAP